MKHLGGKFPNLLAFGSFFLVVACVPAPPAPPSDLSGIPDDPHAAAVTDAIAERERVLRTEVEKMVVEPCVHHIARRQSRYRELAPAVTSTTKWLLQLQGRWESIVEEAYAELRPLLEPSSELERYEINKWAARICMYPHRRHQPPDFLEEKSTRDPGTARAVERLLQAEGLWRL